MKAIKSLNNPEIPDGKVYVKPKESPWGASLVQRIQRPTCGCLRRFDPIIKKEIQNSGTGCQPLIRLCRHAILKTIPLPQLDAALNRMPLPSLLAKDLCKLQLDDFFINPLKVQTQDLFTNCYNATVSFTGQEVLLEVLPTGPPRKDFRKCPDYMASFQDKGMMCIVWDPVISLQELLRVTACVGQTLTPDFVWQVIKAASSHILNHCQAYNWQLTSSAVKLTKNKGLVYIDCDTTLTPSKKSTLIINHPPEIYSRGQYSPEKAFVWALGALIYETVTLMPLVYDSSIRNPSTMTITFRVHPQTKKTNRKMPSREAFNRLIEDTALRQLIHDCLKENPLDRPTIKSILKLVKKERRQYQHH